MFKTIEEIQAAKTSDLVLFWNANHVDAPIKKFADRKTAEKRCIALMETLVALEAEAPKKAAQVWEDDNVRPVVHKPRNVVVKEAPVVDIEDENLSDEEVKAQLLASIEEDKAGRKSNAAAIAKSWRNPDVYNARLTRNGVVVEVNGKKGEFKSVRAAFAELGLPDSKHIRFRMKLKAAKVAIFEWAGVEYKFSIV